jgi:hypothetical protein
MQLVKREVRAAEIARVIALPQRKSAGLVGRALAGLRGISRGNSRPAVTHVRVLETLQIQDQRLTLVSCSGERFLVGTGSDGAQTIMRVRPERVRPEKARQHRLQLVTGGKVCEPANTMAKDDGIRRAFVRGR